MGQHVFDPWILKLAGVAQELWIIQDYEYYLIVLRLETGFSIDNINLFENISSVSKYFFSATLYFSQLGLFRINRKELGSK